MIEHFEPNSRKVENDKEHQANIREMTNYIPHTWAPHLKYLTFTFNEYFIKKLKIK